MMGYNMKISPTDFSRIALGERDKVIYEKLYGKNIDYDPTWRDMAHDELILLGYKEISPLDNELFSVGTLYQLDNGPLTLLIAGNHFVKTFNEDKLYYRSQVVMAVHEIEYLNVLCWTPEKSEIKSFDLEPTTFDDIDLNSFFNEYKDRVNQIKIGEQVLSDQYIELLAKQEQIKSEIEDLKKDIFAKAKGGKDKIGQLTVTNIERKGAVDYKKIPELKGLDLEQYRKKPTNFWKISHV